MKKLTTLILVLCMLSGLVCLAGAEDPQPVTAEELAALGGRLKEMAAESELMNDPADENADLESGYLMMYPFATLFADRTELTEETKINGANIEELEEAGFRGLETGMLPAEAAAAFPNENPEMAGEREEAVLYLKDDADGVVYGVVYRDGQRVDKIEYGHDLSVLREHAVRRHDRRPEPGNFPDPGRRGENRVHLRPGRGRGAGRL